MDSNDLERERGITILAKNTAVRYKGTKVSGPGRDPPPSLLWGSRDGGQGLDLEAPPARIGMGPPSPLRA